MFKNLKRQGERISIWSLMVIFLLILVVLSAFPFVYMMIISLIEKAKSMRLSFETLKNAKWTLENFKKVLIANNYSKFLFNSVLNAVIAVAGACLFASMAGYAFTKKAFIGRDLIHRLFLLTMMVPGVCMIIPQYVIIRKLGLVNTHLAVAMPSFSGAFGVMLMCSFMKGVPDELLEAAEIDGCSEIQKYSRIVLPLVKPALISLAIFTFIGSWGDLLWPLLVNTTMDSRTVTMAVAAMSASGSRGVNYGYTMAGATMAFLPPFILFLFLQKQFVQGIALSGTKT